MVSWAQFLQGSHHAVLGLCRAPTGRAALPRSPPGRVHAASEAQPQPRQALAVHLLAFQPRLYLGEKTALAETQQLCYTSHSRALLLADTSKAQKQQEKTFEMLSQVS